jgi:hypothetical protein
VTCKTRLVCYAVATSQVEFVLILIHPSPIHHVYVSFTQLVRNNYLDWLFTAGTNEFDKTLDAFLPPSAGKRKRGETDDDTNNEVVGDATESGVDVNAEATPVKKARDLEVVLPLYLLDARPKQ